jgi:hypothetical protein
VYHGVQLSGGSAAAAFRREKQTLPDQARLLHPKITRRAAAGRSQYRAPDSIATLPQRLPLNLDSVVAAFFAQ